MALPFVSIHLNKTIFDHKWRFIFKISLKRTHIAQNKYDKI
ncbi:hypothetical protein ACINWC743_2872 [Acinetobacter sp. WC-743]|nr:hypothetical protein ACINWC743_2872 [Acinetobacter sp. WC-743]